MRVPLLLLAGMSLVGVGIVLIAVGAPGRWVLGPALILVGLACKAVGLLTPDDGGVTTRRVRGRMPVTLGGARHRTGQVSSR